MRAILGAGAAAFLALAALTMVSRSPEREAIAPRYFSAEEIARGRRLAQQRRALFWSYQAARIFLLAWLSLSGAAAALAARVAAVAGGRWWLAALLAGAALFLAQELVSLPWGVGSLYHLRAWGLTDRSFGSWLLEHLKALGVSATIGTVLLLGFYALVRLAPRSWWLWSALSGSLLAVFLAYLAPVLIAPLFNSFVPLRDTPHAELERGIEALAARAGLPLKDVLVMDASRQGRYTNAYFSGFGPTRRIVLYDTLLRSHSPEETLSILAHEMGHWRLDHIAKGLALGALGALAGSFLLFRILGWASADGRFGLTAAADPAGLPLILLLSALGGLAVLPVQNAISRGFERAADREALALYGHPRVFIEAERRLARDNIGNVVPSDLNVLLFATHPPTLERIAMAEAFAGGTVPDAR